MGGPQAGSAAQAAASKHNSGNNDGILLGVRRLFSGCGIAQQDFLYMYKKCSK